MKIEQVPLQYVHVVWPQVEHHLAEAFGKYGHGEVTIEQAKLYASSGEWSLYVFTEGKEVHGAMLIQFFNRPNHRVSYVQCVGGREVVTEDTFAQLCALSKAQGATIVECGARPSMVRMLKRRGMAEKYTILGIDL